MVTVSFGASLLAPVEGVAWADGGSADNSLASVTCECPFGIMTVADTCIDHVAVVGAEEHESFGSRWTSCERTVGWCWFSSACTSSCVGMANLEVLV